MAVIRVQRLTAGVLQSQPGRRMVVGPPEIEPRAAAGVVYTHPGPAWHVIIRHVDLMIGVFEGASFMTAFIQPYAGSPSSEWIMFHATSAYTSDVQKKDLGLPWHGQLVLEQGESLYVEAAGGPFFYQFTGAILPV